MMGNISICSLENATDAALHACKISQWAHRHISQDIRVGTANGAGEIYGMSSHTSTRTPKTRFGAHTSILRFDLILFTNQVTDQHLHASLGPKDDAKTRCVVMQQQVGSLPLTIISSSPDCTKDPAE